MKHALIAIVLVLVLASSFVVGALTSPASAGKCDRFCDFCTCHKFICCDGVCTDLGPCGFRCPLIPC